MKHKLTLNQCAVQLRNAATVGLALAISAVIFATATWAQSGNQPSLAAIRAACAADAKKFCSGVQPGGGRVVACLKEHKDELSDGCKKAAGLPVGSSGSSASSDDSSSASSDSDAQPSAPIAPAKPAPASKGAPDKSIPNKSGPATTALAKNTSYKGSEKFAERIINGYRPSRNACRHRSRTREVELRQQARVALWLGRVPDFLFLSCGESRQRRGLLPISTLADG